MVVLLVKPDRAAFAALLPASAVCPSSADRTPVPSQATPRLAFHVAGVTLHNPSRATAGAVASASTGATAPVPCAAPSPARARGVDMTGRSGGPTSGRHQPSSG